MSNLEKKLKKLPASPGVYFFKDKTGEIIYVGKASSLRNRVRSYFQKGRPHDTKTALLVQAVANLEWQPTATEADALFLEAEMVRRYMPNYNILLRDDKSSQFVRIDYKSDYPTVTLVRRPLPDGAKYFGPFINGFALKKALRFLRRAFPYATSRSASRRPSLHYYLGLDPGLENGKTSLSDYRDNLRKLMRYLRGNSSSLIKQLEKEMKTRAKAGEFERAAKVRDQLKYLDNLGRQTLLASSELAETSRDHALHELASLLKLHGLPTRIEGFDISHIQGSDNTASMVVFTLGLPDKASYRKFKLRALGNDDFTHIYETICRRLSLTNIKKWGIPQLVLIDGGKGQLAAALRARDEAGHTKLPIVGIAKKEEKIILHNTLSLPGVDVSEVVSSAIKLRSYVDSSKDFTTILLPPASYALKLLQRIRDESHRFALSYHGSLRRKRALSSEIDSLPGIGPITRKKLIRQFGSTRASLEAPKKQLIEMFGSVRGESIYQQLQTLRR